MTGLLSPKIVGNRLVCFLHDDSRCIHKSWDYSSGGIFVFLQISSWVKKDMS